MEHGRFRIRIGLYPGGPQENFPIGWSPLGMDGTWNGRINLNYLLAYPGGPEENFPIGWSPLGMDDDMGD